MTNTAAVGGLEGSVADGTSQQLSLNTTGSPDQPTVTPTGSKSKKAEYTSPAALVFTSYSPCDGLLPLLSGSGTAMRLRSRP